MAAETDDIKPRAIFRQKSLDRVASPEKLDQYVRVSSPRAWVVLVSIVLLLLAGALWIAVGTVPGTVPTTVVVRDGRVVTGDAANLPDGAYQAQIEGDRISVMSLLFGE